MEKYKKLLAVLVCIAILVSVVQRPKAQAEALTIAALGAAAAVVGVAAGVAISSGAGFDNWISQKLNEHMGGQSPTEYFQGAVLKSVAGKLIIPAVIYNDLKQFWNDYIADNDITEQDAEVIQGVEGFTQGNTGSQVLHFPKATVEVYEDKTPNSGMNHKWVMQISYEGGSVSKSSSSSWPQSHIDLEYTSSIIINRLSVQNNDISFISYFRFRNTETGKISQDSYVSLSAKLSDIGGQQTEFTIGLDPNYPAYEAPDTNLGQSYEADVGGAVDTNIDQLIGQIYEDIDGGNLQVDGEVIEDADNPPVEPTYPPVDYTDVLEGLGSIGGTLEGVAEEVGSIEQTLDGVAENVDSLEQAITEAVEVPDIEDIELHKFDLRGLFPFCIPFDLHDIITAFSTDPVTPEIHIPFNIPSIGLYYTFDLDLHDFDGLAATLRTLEFIAFGVGLLFVTGKVIKW